MKNTKFSFVFNDCESYEDLKIYVEDLVKCGASKISKTSIKNGCGFITAELSNVKEFTRLFLTTASYSFLERFFIKKET